MKVAGLAKKAARLTGQCADKCLRQKGALGTSARLDATQSEIALIEYARGIEHKLLRLMVLCFSVCRLMLFQVRSPFIARVAGGGLDGQLPHRISMRLSDGGFWTKGFTFGFHIFKKTAAAGPP